MSSPSRPNHIDLGSSRSFQAPRFPGTPPAELPPPKTGHAPPALSPLDAFAFQSNLLASRFDEEDGRRISRLPPFMVANEFQRPRPGYFNNNNNNNSNDSPQSSTEAGAASLPARGPPVPAPSGNAPEIGKTSDRHRSFYPHVQNFDDAASVRSNDTDKAPLETVSEERSPAPASRYAQDRSDSPDSFYDARSISSTSRIDFAPGPPSKSSTNESLRSNSNLAPHSYGYPNISRSPRLPFVPPPPPPPAPVRADSDDSDSKSIRSDTNESRFQTKGPVGNMRERPRSPWSPTLHTRRSPSVSSEISNPETSSTAQPRRSFNFSRPMSPANRFHRPSVESRPSFENSTRLLQIEGTETRPSMDVISIQESVNDSPAILMRPFANADVASNLTDDETASPPRRDEEQPESSSYTYARYALPRGRKVMSRTSMAAADWLASKIDWDQKPMSEQDGGRPEDARAALSRSSTLEKQPIEEKPEPQSRPSTSKGFKGKFVEVMDDEDGPPPPALPQGNSPPDLGIRIVPPTPLTDTATTKSHSFDEARPQPEFLKKQQSNPAMSQSATSTPTDRHFPEIPTLHHKLPARDRTKSDPRAASDMRTFSKATENSMPSLPDQGTAEQHLAKGIASHEEGSLQKSTYHLRLAARGGHPTAMLLYALACRHGWGMRANQAEGLNWLRKAVDLSKIEVGNDQLLKGPNMDGVLAHADAAAKRAHKAQLALSIYELGISYMNGWGIATDKVLALRCFEIAGGWGDADALVEAGFCYAKGVGCKKDLYKAADLYRRAEAKGISMAGNSWIYKDKYMPKDEEREERKGRAADKDSGDKKKPRDKSRTRTFFGGKKKHPDLPS